MNRSVPIHLNRSVSEGPTDGFRRDIRQRRRVNTNTDLLKAKFAEYHAAVNSENEEAAMQKLLEIADGEILNQKHLLQLFVMTKIRHRNGAAQEDVISLLEGVHKNWLEVFGAAA